MATSDATLRVRLDAEAFARDLRKAKRRLTRPRGWTDWAMLVLGVLLMIGAVIGGPVAHDWGRAVFDLVLGTWLIERSGA